MPPLLLALSSVLLQLLLVWSVVDDAAAVITVKSDAAAPLPAYFMHKPQRPEHVTSGDDSDDDFGDDDNDAVGHQLWERVWTVGAHAAVGQDYADEVDEVLVSIPGPVFVSTSSSASASWSWSAPPLATVRFSGDSEHTLDNFEVVSNARGVLEIRQRTASTKTRFRGYLLVEVTLTHAQKLQRVTCKAAGQVVVDANVLVTDAPNERVSVTVDGSGDVFVHDTPALHVQHVALAVSGSGAIEFSTTQIEATTLALAVSGSGAIRLFANTVHANEATVAVAGSGRVYVNSYNFDAVSVNVAIAGSGDVSVYPIGTCKDEFVAIGGSGDAFLGSLVCESVVVKIGGSGDVIVQATDSISGGIVGSGDVKYVGSVPRSIAPETSIFTSGNKKNPTLMATATTHNKFVEAKMHRLPERTPVRLTDANVVDLRSRAALVPLVIVALLAAWYIHHENTRQNARSRREELQPLATGQTQVYV